MMQLEQHAETTARVSIPSRSTCIDRQRRTFHSTACTHRVCAWQSKWLDLGRVVGPLLAQMLHGLTLRQGVEASSPRRRVALGSQHVPSLPLVYELMAIVRTAVPFRKLALVDLATTWPTGRIALLVLPCPLGVGD